MPFAHHPIAFLFSSESKIWKQKAKGKTTKQNKKTHLNAALHYNHAFLLAFYRYLVLREREKNVFADSFVWFRREFWKIKRRYRRNGANLKYIGNDQNNKEGSPSLLDHSACTVRSILCWIKLHFELFDKYLIWNSCDLSRCWYIIYICYVIFRVYVINRSIWFILLRKFKLEKINGQFSECVYVFELQLTVYDSVQQQPRERWKTKLILSGIRKAANCK